MGIVITGGGTGGHLSVAKAIKDELNKRGIKPVFIGSKNGQDRLWFENDDGFLDRFFLESSGVVNKGGISKIASLSKILYNSYECKKIFDNYNIKAVFSVGGYSAAPASFGAVFFKKKLFIHEQNAKIGTLNKLLKPFSEAFFSSYLDDSPIKDYPVRDIFFKNKRVRDTIKTILFLGGSQGASAINNYAMQIAPILKEKNIKVIHQSGKRDFLKLKKFYEDLEFDVDLFDFSNEIDKKIKEADFAISRSGASSMWELVASCLPALFIPYPYAAGDHQYYNALFLKEKDLCFLVREDELSKDLIFKILEDQDFTKKSKELCSMINPEGAKKIVDFILKDLDKEA